MQKTRGMARARVLCYVTGVIGLLGGIFLPLGTALAVNTQQSLADTLTLQSVVGLGLPQ